MILIPIPAHLTYLTHFSKLKQAIILVLFTDTNVPYNNLIQVLFQESAIKNKIFFHAGTLLRSFSLYDSCMT